MSALDQIRAKITRAEQHIQDLQLGIAAFHDSGPYQVTMREDAQLGKRIFYLSKVEPIPYALAAIAADVIQNLRSSLDQIAFQLVLAARSGSEPKWKVYFPIAWKASQYKALRGRYIQGVRQEVVDAIDTAEPYPGGKGHALWQLHELNKIDKHKLLLSTGGFFRSVDVSGRIELLMRKMPGFENFQMSALNLRPADKLLPLKVGDELYTEGLDVEVDKKMTFTLQVSVNKPGVIEGEPVLKTLQDMANLVRDVVERLGRFLPP